MPRCNVNEGVDDAIVDALLQDQPPVLEGPRGFHPVLVLISVMLYSCTKFVEKGLSKPKIHVGIAVSFQRKLCLVGFGNE